MFCNRRTAACTLSRPIIAKLESTTSVNVITDYVILCKAMVAWGGGGSALRPPAPPQANTDGMPDALYLWYVRAFPRNNILPLGWAQHPYGVELAAPPKPQHLRFPEPLSPSIDA